MSLGPSLVNIARSVPNVGVVPSLLKREEALIEREKTLADVNGKDAGAGSDALDPALLEAINRWTSKPSGLWSPNRFYDNWKGKREIESDATIVERDVKPPIWKPAGAFRLSSWLKNWRREVETDSVEIEERSPSYIFKPAGNWKLGSWLSSWNGKREAAPTGKAAFNREIIEDMKRSTVAELD